MTGRWRGLNEPERETARTVFAALDAARRLADAGGPARPSPSAIWSALVSGSPLPADVDGGADLEAMLAQSSVAAIPRLAAAATPGVNVERRGAGVRVRLVPARGDGGMTYLTIAVDDPGMAASRLIVVLDGRAPLQLDLPEPVAGVVQILLAGDAPILAGLTDPESRLYLV